ncbi:MAG: MFS transporter [Pseudomonadota bacterium]
MESTQSSTTARRRTLAAGISGNVMEWYDFAVYGFFAPIVARLFFPDDNAVLSLVAAYGAFAAGFLMRPLGAIVFGHIGDRYGRKRALLVSVSLMAIPSLCISFLPTYQDIGIWAGVFLVLLRMAQGIAVGGEYTTSIVYLAESAPKGRRGYFASWALFGANAGILLGSLVGAGLSAAFPADVLQDWGWRIPFFCGIFVAITSYFIRRGITVEAQSRTLKFPLAEAIRHHWQPLLIVIFLNSGFAVLLYTGYIYLAGWLVSEVGETHAEAMTINSIGMFALILMVPFFAILSDRVGRKPLMFVGFSALVVLAHPLAWAMSHPDPRIILAGQLVYSLFMALFMAPLPATLTELFPSKVRVTAVGIGYNISFGIFGGTAPMIATWLVGTTKDPTFFAWYVMAMALLSLITMFFLKETAQTENLGASEEAS